MAYLGFHKGGKFSLVTIVLTVLHNGEGQTVFSNFFPMGTKILLAKNGLAQFSAEICHCISGSNWIENVAK